MEPLTRECHFTVCVLTYIHTHTSAPASIAADMVEVSASTNPLDVNLTVSYVGGDSITHAYPYTVYVRVPPCMQGP